MLGVAVGVLIHLKSVSESAVERLPRESKTGVIGFYMSVVLMSKISLSETILVCHFSCFLQSVSYYYLQTTLDDFVSTYVTRDDFEKDILPTIEKSLLRSPEISLPGNSTPNDWIPHLIVLPSCCNLFSRLQRTTATWFVPASSNPGHQHFQVNQSNRPNKLYQSF